MPTDLIHRIGIAAPPETIYRALTTQESIRAWWTTSFRIPTGFKSFSPGLRGRSYPGSSSKEVINRNAVASPPSKPMQPVPGCFPYCLAHPA